MTESTASFTLPPDAQARLEMLANQCSTSSRTEEGREQSGGKPSKPK